MAYNQGKNPFSKNPLNFNSPLNSFDSLVGKLMNQGKSKEAATKIAGKVANMKMKGAGSGPTAAQKARMKGSPAKQAKPDFLDLDKDGNTSEPMKDAAKGSPANLKSPIDKELVGKQKNLPEGLKKAIEAAPESPAKMKSPMKKHSDAHIRKEAKRIARKNKGDEQDIYYELKSKYAQEKKDAVKKAKETAKPSPANAEEGMFSKAVEDKSLLKEKPATVESASKAVKDFGKKVDQQRAGRMKKKPATAKSKGVVSSEGRDGSNRQERKKRRQERRSIRKRDDLSASQKRMAIKESRKQQKDNVKGVKKDSPAKMKSPGGKRNPYTNSPMGDLSGKKVYGPATAAIAAGKKVVKKINKARANVKSTINKNVRPKVKKAVRAVKEFSKDLQKRGT